MNRRTWTAAASSGTMLTIARQAGIEIESTYAAVDALVLWLIEQPDIEQAEIYDLCRRYAAEGARA